MKVYLIFMFWKIKYYKDFNSPPNAPQIESVDSMQFYYKTWALFFGWKLADCKFYVEVQSTKNNKDSHEE